MSVPATRPIETTRHAVQRWKDRRCDDRTYHEVGQEIIGLVADALAAGRVQNHKPAGFGLYKEKRKNLPPGQRCVWTEDGSVAFVLAREEAKDVVLTTLTRSGL